MTRSNQTTFWERLRLYIQPTSLGLAVLVGSIVLSLWATPFFGTLLSIIAFPLVAGMFTSLLNTIYLGKQPTLRTIFDNALSAYTGYIWSMALFLLFITILTLFTLAVTYATWALTHSTSLLTISIFFDTLFQSPVPLLVLMISTVSIGVWRLVFQFRSVIVISDGAETTNPLLESYYLFKSGAQEVLISTLLRLFVTLSCLSLPLFGVILRSQNSGVTESDLFVFVGLLFSVALSFVIWFNTYNKISLYHELRNPSRPTSAGPVEYGRL